MRDTPMKGEMHFGETSLWALKPWKHLAYGMLQDLGYALYSEYGVEYLPFLEAQAPKRR